MINAVFTEAARDLKWSNANLVTIDVEINHWQSADAVILTLWTKNEGGNTMSIHCDTGKFFSVFITVRLGNSEILELRGLNQTSIHGHLPSANTLYMLDGTINGIKDSHIIVHNRDVNEQIICNFKNVNSATWYAWGDNSRNTPAMVDVNARVSHNSVIGHIDLRDHGNAASLNINGAAYSNYEITKAAAVNIAMTAGQGLAGTVHLTGSGGTTNIATFVKGNQDQSDVILRPAAGEIISIAQNDVVNGFIQSATIIADGDAGEAIKLKSYNDRWIAEFI